MPDIDNRDAFELDLATRLARVLSRQRREVIVLLGDPPNMVNIPAEWWTAAGIELQAVIAPIMEEIFLQQVGAVVDVATIGIEWGLANEAAITWANQYTFGLVTELNNTTRNAIQSAVRAFYDQGLSINDLRLRLMRDSVLGPVRAEMIAVTEVTRAAAEGERQTAAQIAQDTGVVMIPIWNTADDEIAHKCPICWPRHLQPIMNGEFPPAHPRCRCWVTYELPEPEAVMA